MIGTARIVRGAGLLLSAFAVIGSEAIVFAQETLEEITVTGTRIVRRDYSAQTPIVTLDQETFTNRSNIGIEATLNQLPQFNVAGTQSQLSPANTPFPQAGAAPGAATVDLRGIGLNRTLVLMDGRRVQPINGLLVVDVNTVPAAAIDRVEIITGGAAAVYGADAISGVVNFILKRNFEGLEFGGRYGVTGEGDGEEASFSGLFGANFSDGRGNVMIGADYSRREIIYGQDRDWIAAGWNDPGTTAGGIGSSNLSQYQVDPANAPTNGWIPPGRNYIVDPNGNVFDALNPLNPAHPFTGQIGGSGPTSFKLNPDGSLGFIDRENNFLQLPLERYALFGAGRYDLADDVELFADVRFSETFATAQGFRSGAFNVWSPTVPFNPATDNPASPTFGTGTSRHPVPPQLGALLAARATNPAARWTYVGGLDYLDNFRTETTSNVYQVLGGLRGRVDIGSRRWSWETFASHGKTTVNARQPEGFPYLPRIQNLFNADQYGRNFDISSLPGFFPLAVTGHCTSGLPLFNPDGSVNNTPSVSQDCSDYVVLRLNNITTLTQEIVEANVQGQLATMPAGDLMFALGATKREEVFAFDPDTGFNANQDFPNVIQNIILPTSVAGSTDVTEVYGELAIPLVRDKKFVQLFEIDPGVRASDYNTVGHVTTYKTTFDWTVNDRLKFRGGRQVANRAPNITELFTPKGGSILEFNAQDACGSWAQSPVWGNVPGNPNRLNLQILCQHLMVRDGAPPSLYVPGGSADTWMYNVFGGTFNFPFSIGVTEGNPGLASEEAETYTFGAVISLERVTLAVDWYDIDLTGAIGTPAFSTIYQQCMDPRYNPLIDDAPGAHTGAALAAGNQYCSLINREYVGTSPANGATGAARTFDARYINQGGIQSRGVDVAFDWRSEPGPASQSWNVNFLTTRLHEFSQTAFPGAIPVNYTGTVFNSSFDYKAITTVRYDRPDWSIGLRWQHLPKLDRQPGAAPTVFGVDSHDQLDLFTRWSFGEKYTLMAGIDNLADADPEVVGRTTANNALGSTSTDYDTFGRRVYVGVNIGL